MTPALITLAAVAVVASVAFLGRRRGRRKAEKAPLELDSLVGLVLFFSDVACTRCDLMRRRLEKLEVNFVEIAHNHEPGLLDRIGVTGVPLLVIRDKSGVIVDRVAGAASVWRIRRALARSG